MKRDYNPQNERIKHKFRVHLSRAMGKDHKTINAHIKNLVYYEKFYGYEDFRCYNAKKADHYINGLMEKGLSMSFIHTNLRDLRVFLKWLERQTGYKSKINYNHIDYLNLTNKQKREAKATDYQKSYKYEEILKTIRSMPSKTLLEKRDRAIISLQALCTLRVSELMTVKLKNIIHENDKWFIHVSPKSMDVKFSKARTVFFLPLPDDITKVVLDWLDILKRNGFRNDDPIFPRFKSQFNTENLLEPEITHNVIKSGTTIRKIFKKAFEKAGYEYIKPHSFRHTIAIYAQTQSPAFMNAVRQNLGHSSIDTTMSSYGNLSRLDQAGYLHSCRIGV